MALVTKDDNQHRGPGGRIVFLLLCMSILYASSEAWSQSAVGDGQVLGVLMKDDVEAAPLDQEPASSTAETVAVEPESTEAPQPTATESSSLSEASQPEVTQTPETPVAPEIAQEAEVQRAAPEEVVSAMDIGDGEGAPQSLASISDEKIKQAKSAPAAEKASPAEPLAAQETLTVDLPAQAAPEPSAPPSSETVKAEPEIVPPAPVVEAKNEPAQEEAKQEEAQTSVEQEIAAAEKEKIEKEIAEKKKASAAKKETVSSVSSSEALDALFGQNGQTTVKCDLTQISSLKPDLMEPLPLDEAVSYALQNNYEVRAFAERLKGTKWEKIGAYSQYLPAAEFAYAEGAEISMPGSYNGADGQRIDKTIHHRRDRNLHIRQPLIDLTVVAEIMKAGDAVDLADTEKRDNQEATVSGTVTAYLKLLQARKAIEMFDEYQELLKQLADRMQARLDEGGATKSDVNRIQSRMDVAEAARLQALGEYGTNIAEFKRLAHVVPSALVMPVKLVPQVPPTPDAALETAWKANPAYIAAIKKADLARGDRNKSFSGVLPKVSAEYSDSYNFNAGGASHGNAIDGVYPNQRDKRYMLVARWNLTGGTQITSGIAGMKKVKEMTFKADDVRARLEQGIFSAYDGLNATRNRIAILKKTYETDRQIVADLEEQFVQGDRSLFEILDSQDRLHTTKVELMKALFNEALLAYQIRLQMGEIAQAVLGDRIGQDGQ